VFPEQALGDNALHIPSSMKAVKIIFAIIAALWALAYIPNLIAGVSHGNGSLAFSHMMGTLVGFLLASAISIVLFRSALRK
jgi:hypothetical protein